ncbi:hypothetical protein Bca101_096260 [Brassica carinata]
MAEVSQQKISPNLSLLQLAVCIFLAKSYSYDLPGTHLQHLRRSRLLNSKFTNSLKKKGKALEDLTWNVKQIQDDLLKEILTLNSGTEYLQNFLHGSSAKEIFKKKLPVVTYKDVKPFFDRVANGESSDIISALPLTNFFMR